MRGREVTLRVRTVLEGDAARELQDRIVDVYTRDAAEWIRLGSGEEIRLGRDGPSEGPNATTPTGMACSAGST